ncbi:MAG: dethiobiotin synthase [Spirochaetia bacterium]|nr:dethiobiotin synthase [Spirochaetia bacterium]
MALFVTGTDTGVGKTHAAAAILHRYRHIKNIKYWKPVQTGIDVDPLDATIVRSLTGLDESFFLPTTLRYKAPLSPHRAAELENSVIDLDDLLTRFAQEAGNSQTAPLIVEGAGGILVPLNRKQTWIDFIHAASIPVVVVARTGLGTINHTLLTIEYLRRQAATIVGVIYCGESNEDNIRTISEMSGVPSLGQFYFRGIADFAMVDAKNRLEQYLV